MCIGIPMKVLSTRAGFARVCGRGEEREVDTALVGAVQPGDWLLVFIDAARERIAPERAAEVNAVLDLLNAALVGADLADDPGFALPSAMGADQLAAFGARPRKETLQ
jgi:hydrogenase expression/formation protein HypC